MSEGRIVVRASALVSYPDCERRGATRLFRREIIAAGYRLRDIRRGVGAAIGTAVHKGAAIALDEKAQSGSLPPATVATDAAIGILRDQFSEGVELDGPRGVTHTPRDAERQTLAMVSSYHRTIAPTVQPIHVEERLEAEVEPGIILTGHPDVVAREPQAIRDLKTGTRGPSTFAAQIGAYSLLARSHALDIEQGRIDFIKRVSTTRPQPDPISRAVPIESAETAASSILKHIARDIATFRHGDPVRRILPGDVWAFTANPSSILCSPKYCSAFGTEFCHEGDPEKETGK